MALRKIKWPLVVVIFFGFVHSARADDADIQMTTTNGSTLIGFQNSSAQNVVTVNSAGVLQVSSNTILPGTTFYQNGAVVMGANQTVAISSNTVLPGATFYQNGAISLGAGAQSVKFSSNVVVSGGNATIFQNGNIAVSSATFNGFAQLLSLTNTALHAITPSAVGQLYYCNNCAAASVVCVSTGTTVGAFGEIESKTTACN
jgi:hypothetical protein